jgi:hypothetical protein
VIKLTSGDPDGCAVWDVGLRQLASWEYRLESRRQYVWFYVVNVMCCQVEILREADPCCRGVLPSVCIFVCMCIECDQMRH